MPITGEGRDLAMFMLLKMLLSPENGIGMLSVVVLPGDPLPSPLLSTGCELYLPGAGDPDLLIFDLGFVVQEDFQ